MMDSISSKNCPAAPTKGSPCKSSFSPGPSPMNITSICSGPTPNTTLCRVFESSQRVQLRQSARRASRFLYSTGSSPFEHSNQYNDEDYQQEHCCSNHRQQQDLSGQPQMSGGTGNQRFHRIRRRTGRGNRRGFRRWCGCWGYGGSRRGGRCRFRCWFGRWLRCRYSSVARDTCLSAGRSGKGCWWKKWHKRW